MANGLFFLHERPASASSWSMPEVDELLNSPLGGVSGISYVQVWYAGKR